jgi:hypothetical protein
MVLVASLGGIGCASVPLPQDQVQQYEASVELAKQLGVLKPRTGTTAKGALGLTREHEHFLLAGDEMAVAQDLAHHGDTRSALLLARAQSDVDLAIALAREAKVRRHVAQAQAQAQDGSDSAALISDNRKAGGSR